mmetsp:Transcript_14138/g.32822  ORF Transcript_14138/g.32822 Transcript_14138/m.32822 type:complete len:232 (+) Transcript_14138:85-780(+)
MLRHVGDLGIGVAVERPGTGVRGQFPAQDFEEGGLAGPVLAEDGDATSDRDIERHVLKQPVIIVVLALALDLALVVSEPAVVHGDQGCVFPGGTLERWSGRKPKVQELFVFPKALLGIVHLERRKPGRIRVAPLDVAGTVHPLAALARRQKLEALPVVVVQADTGQLLFPLPGLALLFVVASLAVGHGLLLVDEFEGLFFLLGGGTGNALVLGPELLLPVPKGRVVPDVVI